MQHYFIIQKTFIKIFFLKLEFLFLKKDIVSTKILKKNIIIIESINFLIKFII